MSETFAVGDAVRVAQGVRRHGTAPGFVVMVNETGGPLLDPTDGPDGPRHPEYGVILGTHRPTWRHDMPGQLQYDSDAVRWFAPHELVRRTG